MKTQIKLILIFLFCFSIVSGQIENYDYQREITGISDTWHKIVLPDEMFGKLKNDLNDIRIYGITEQDTFEAPYLLKMRTGSIQWKDIPFKLINQSYNADGYFFTLRIPSDNIINQIDLNFSNSNYDWRVNLEGSQNQRDWYTIIENHRILSIYNEITNYTFSTLKIPNSHYTYYRLLIKSSEKPTLSSAKIYECKIVEGAYRQYPTNTKKIHNSDKYKRTVIEITLPMPVPVSFIKIRVSDKIDYYRPLSIQYLVDSIKTEKGWKYNYSSPSTETLSSLEENEYKLNQQITNKLKIVIQNHDNLPLKVESVTVRGHIHELVARFNKAAQYYLVYGNKKAYKPNYDIINFQENIPKELNELVVGDEEKIGKAEMPLIGPLFQNQAWLWGIMIIIILVLGWFSIRMLKSK